MKKIILLLVLLSVAGLSINAQKEKCATMKHWEKIKEMDPDAQHRMEQLELQTRNWIKSNQGQRSALIVTIPVVVHVVYHTDTENVSESQINSQIVVLNEDFRKLNTDTLSPSHPFYPLMGDSEIEFCLAQQDPDGNISNGITRTFTNSTSFSGNDSEKFDESGGKNNWDPTQYLNLWVCNLGSSDGTLGYATFPSDLADFSEYDGVVIDFRAFGTEGTAGSGDFEYNDLGRTATHEVGHWLNLSHIWGDAECGDDKVADTPTAEMDNAGCPTFPYNANSVCGTDENGEMYMNFMDYTDDECMAMFSNGQSNRMEAAIMAERSELLNSEGCTPVTGIANLNEAVLYFMIFPNPSEGYFFVDLQSEQPDDVEIKVINMLGEIVYQRSMQSVITLSKYKIDISNEASGIYFVNIKKGDYTTHKKLIIEK